MVIGTSTKNLDLAGLNRSSWNVRGDRNNPGGPLMPRKSYTPEELIQHLRTVELEGGKGLPVQEACRKVGITEHTYERWRSTAGCAWITPHG